METAFRARSDSCECFYQLDLITAQSATATRGVSFFWRGLDAASERLRNFIESAQATLLAQVFDDAATAGF